MTTILRRGMYALLLVLATAASASAQGFIKGSITDKQSGAALSGIRVQVMQAGRFIKGAYSKSDGAYSLAALSAGKYDVAFSGVGRRRVELSATVTDGATTTLDASLTEEAAKLGNITVYGAARREQKLTEAPAAISTVLPEDLRRATAHGQIGKTLEHIQGVDVVQSGMNDFNINTRGFNNSINRRMLVLLDGRDHSTPLLNLVEWNSFQTDIADVKSLEVVRGPGSALYGANAYNGVINITTNSPRDVPGTRVSLTGGEYGTFRANARHAGTFGNNLSYKVSLGYTRQNQDWVTSRQLDSTKPNFGLEYPGIARDIAGYRQGFGNITDPRGIDTLINDHRTAFNNFGAARVDYNLSDDERILLEGGFSKYGNEYFVNQTGRILIIAVEKPFARVAYNSPRLNVQAQWTNRFAPIAQVVMNAAATSGDKSNVLGIEAQWNDVFMDGDLKMVAGASHEIQNVKTSVAGASALLSPDNQNHNFSGFYGQAEYTLLKNLYVVGAARLDRSSYFETQFSPKGAIVFSPEENHTFRLTVNRSFLRPSYGDRFRRSPAGAPVGAVTRRDLDTVAVTRTLGAMDSLISSQTGAAPLGLGSTPVWNLGNPNVGVETAMSYEFGYKGVISEDLFVTVDVYMNRRTNFISNPLGGLAPEVFAPVRYDNAAANDSLKKWLGATNFDRLAADNSNAKPAFIVTPRNIGLVEEKGLEIGANYYPTKELMLFGNVAYLAVNVVENDVPTSKILPNTSPRRYNIGAQYTESDWDVTLSFRYVEGFAWIAGLVEGFVPDYGVMNLNANYKVTKGLNIGVNVFNLLDREHYEIFGGTYLYRYATGTVSYTF